MVNRRKGWYTCSSYNVTKWTIPSQKCRYKWLISPLIHRNAIASLDWIGKSALVPLLKKKMKKQKKQSKRNLVTPKQRLHTHIDAPHTPTKGAAEHRHR